MINTELTFSPIKKANNYFFKVAQTPVRYEDPLDKTGLKKYPGKKIIINASLNEGISIVGSSFLPVMHEQAFDLGVAIFELMFGVTPQIHKEAINKRTTDYCVDLISEKCKIIFDSRGYRYSGNKRFAPETEGNRKMERTRKVWQDISY